MQLKWFLGGVVVALVFIASLFFAASLGFDSGWRQAMERGKADMRKKVLDEATAGYEAAYKNGYADGQKERCDGKEEEDE